jgi:hypothetical protein
VDRKTRLELFESMFPAVEAGDTLVFTDVPGRGTPLGSTWAIAWLDA